MDFKTRTGSLSILFARRSRWPARVFGLAVIDTELHSTRDVHADGEGITALSVASAPSISRP
jgi:hypothetical protein